MDPVSQLSRNILFPLADLYRGINPVRAKRYLSQSQFLPEEHVRANQWRQLQYLLHYVYHHNTFYRERFDRLGASPEDIKSPEDFTRFPPLTKDDLKTNLDALICQGINRSELILRRTGGSTGVPVQLYQDRQCQSMKEALVRRHNAWAHFILGQKYAALWGDIKPSKNLMRMLFDKVALRTIYLDTLKMNAHNTWEFARKISETRTRLLFGHGHSIYYFARFLRENGIDNVRLDSIISTAEMLPPEERHLVEDVFGNVVFDRYGCEEIGLIASECDAHEGLHLAAEGVYVEVPSRGDGIPGPMLVTDLLNKGTPLIRYEIGDIASFATGLCGCGRGLPRLASLIGRTSDLLYTPEGNIISGISILDTVVIHIPGIKQAQIVQEQLDELTINVVKDSHFSPESANRLKEQIAKYFGPKMKISVVFVDSVPLSSRGKFQFTVCKVKATSSL